MYDGIIFSGSSLMTMRTIGPYRIRSILEENEYRIKVIDFSQALAWASFKQNNVYEKLLDKYLNERSIFLGISTTFLDPEVIQLLLDKNIIENIKRKYPKLNIIVGGSKVKPNSFNGLVDWAVAGYADTAIVKVLDYITGRTNTIKAETVGLTKYVFSNEEYSYENTSNLTTTWSSDDYIQNYEALPIEIARGCIFKCSFCAYPLNGKKKFDYIRAKENFSQELANNYTNFGVTNYMFMDDTFNDSDFKIQLISDAIKQSQIPIKFSSYIKPELLVTWPGHRQQLVEMGLQGASLGIESFYPKTRTAIGKGMDIEKVMSAIHELRKYSNYSLGTQANMIVGSPWEPRNSIEETAQWYDNNYDIISTVHWNYLTISRPISSIYSSAIDLNPERFGYTITGTSKEGFCSWKNEHFTFHEAKEIVKGLKEKNKNQDRLGGWQPGLFRIYNNFDVDKTLKNNVLRKDIDYSPDTSTAITDFIKRYYQYQRDL
jgi:radical SAM superfamily enzyme YgiQ (UPF0313 family)